MNELNHKLKSVPPHARRYVDYVSLSRNADTSDDKRKPLRVAFLRNFTIEPLLPVLSGELTLAGLPSCHYLSNFDAIASDVMTAKSPFFDFSPDIIILAQWLDRLNGELATAFLCGGSNASAHVDRVVGLIDTFLGAIRRGTPKPILINNFPVPVYVPLGILDSQRNDYQRSVISNLNSRLVQLAQSHQDVFLVDYQRVFNELGYRQAFDARYWQQSSAPLSQIALATIGQEYAKYIRALAGLTKKCLVLDCDDTLWGGLIGEDGIDGIRLGPNYPGNCFVAFQNEILGLHQRGILLALNSKNNEADVLDVIRRHPSMVLREEHIATWQINWDDKATNIQRIADTLHAHLDSMVFVDDSPLEIDLINSRLPNVATIQVPKSSSQVIGMLLSSGYFDSLSYSGEDQSRTAHFVASRRFAARTEAPPSQTEYLKSLDIQTDIGLAGPAELPRISQLVLKTNQFNLTVQRHHRGDIERLATSPNSAVFYVKVRERIGDLGLVGVASLRIGDRIAHIDDFLLSCRALGRGVESVLLIKVGEYAFRHLHCHTLRGYYKPSTKNAQVRDFYAKHAFSPDGCLSDAWQLSSSEYESLAQHQPEWLNVRAPTWEA